MKSEGTVSGATSQSHAVRMNRNYRFQRHIYDATRRHYLHGRAHLIERMEPPDEGTVLEIGTGTASNLIAAARRYPSARLYGVDISTLMLETAGEAIARNDLSHRIRLQLVDASRLDARAHFDTPQFDRVFFSYSLSMTPDWRGALAAAAAHVKPGGRLQIVDFGEMEGMPAIARKAIRLWLALYAVTPRDDLRPQLQEMARSWGAGLEMTPLWGGYAVYAEFARPD